MWRISQSMIVVRGFLARSGAARGIRIRCRPIRSCRNVAPNSENKSSHPHIERSVSEHREDAEQVAPGNRCQLPCFRRLFQIS
jgi:hypothetical protein